VLRTGREERTGGRSLELLSWMNVALRPQIRDSQPGDMAAVQDLLQRAGLPTDERTCAPPAFRYVCLRQRGPGGGRDRT